MHYLMEEEVEERKTSETEATWKNGSPKLGGRWR